MVTVVAVEDCIVKEDVSRCLFDGVKVVVPVPLVAEDGFDEPLDKVVEEEFALGKCANCPGLPAGR